MLKQIFKKTIDIFKKNALLSVSLCLIGVLSAALVFSLIFIPAFGEMMTVFIVMPLVLIPLIFAIQIMHYGLRENTTPTGGIFFRFFRLYFSPGFMGVYRVINSILFALLAELGISMITGTIVTYLGGNPAFANSVNELLEAMKVNDTDLINGILLRPEIQTLFYVSYIPGFGMGVMVAFLSASFNSMSLYYKVNNPTVNPAFSSKIYLIAKNSIRGSLIKEYWALNWPLFVLFIAGYCGGACISYFSELNYVFGQVIATLVGLGATILYMPLFVTNLENIYLSHKDTWDKAPALFAERMQAALTAQMGSIQAQMNELNKQKQDLENHSKNEEPNTGSSTNDDNSKFDNHDDHVIIDAEVKDDKDDNEK